jgi:hypothetical protein
MKFKCLDLPILVIFFTILLNALGFRILIPIIPLLLADPKSQYFMLPHNFTLGQGYIIFGFLVAIYPLMQFLATPILGQLSDKFGRKKILGISLAGTFVAYILLKVVDIAKGFNSNTAMFKYARDKGAKRADMYEIGLFREIVTLSGDDLFFTISIPQESVVIPETIDAIRASLSLQIDWRSAVALTDKYLGMGDRA